MTRVEERYDVVQESEGVYRLTIPTRNPPLPLARIDRVGSMDRPFAADVANAGHIGVYETVVAAVEGVVDWYEIVRNVLLVPARLYGDWK